MIRDSVSTKERIIIGLLAVFVLFLGYNKLSYNQHVINPDDTTMPTMSQFKDGIKELSKSDTNGERWITTDASATLGRLCTGLVLSLIIGFGLGIVMGCKARWHAFFDPIVSFASAIAPTAAIAIFFVIAGTGFKMYTTIIIFGVAPILTENIYEEVKNFPIELLNKARSWGATELELVWNIIIPHILPKTLLSFAQQIGPAIIYLVPAEMMVGHEGMGYRIRLTSKLLNMNIAYPYLIMLAMFLVVARNSLKLMVKKIFKWY